ncbi:glycosyltransferase family 2 protein [Megasphaera stantonii]|uniref:Glycosyltransferase family 2 protein n=1 Tax=Megasphaera stantonii TaxID=2144175 RepID=A0A346B1U4_9FIRM|nr:glycosyltransferase family 2 protein [Megasphaera stantonii]AXL22087.1 glycosyltransferase family 2 protein [Megasphaera stantonii]
MFYKDLDVIIPTYNRAPYLKIALESLCESIATWRKIIILNNASTDNTLEVIEYICKKYPERKIEVVTNKCNIGNPANFKKTQTLATNKYVAIFHDDDAIHPEYIDRAMQLFIENEKKVVMISGGASALYNVNHENWSICPDSYWYYPANKNIFLQLLIGRPIFCNCIYKTDVYKNVKYEPEKFGKLHDIIFMAKLCEQGDFIFVHGECVRWRQHAKSDSNTLKTGPFPSEILNILKELKKIFCLENKKKQLFCVNK